MAVQKVEFDGRTLIDLTQDTVTPQMLYAGHTAHDKDGNIIQGEMSVTYLSQTTTLRTASSEVSFSNLPGDPQSFAIVLDGTTTMGKSENGILSVFSDGEQIKGIYSSISGNTLTGNVTSAFNHQFTNGTLYVQYTGNGIQFSATTYRLLGAYVQGGGNLIANE